ncbi:MAG: rod shape-determining protein MreC [Candidatus Parcubacteria bacterium]|jgi:cell shape-determining protein MreC
MNRQESKRLKVNIIFIIIFILFVFSFSSLKYFLGSNRDTNSNKINESGVFLKKLNDTASKIYNFFPQMGVYFSSRNSLVKERDLLKIEIENQKEKIVELSESQRGSLEQDASLASSSNVIDIGNKNTISAKPIFKDFTSIYDTLLLDKGFVDGVEKGDKVFLYPNLAVGEIESIDRNTSLLKLFSKNENKVEVLMKNEKENTILDIYGIGSGDFYAELPESMEISPETILYLLSDDRKAVGIVSRVEKREASFFQDVLIKGYYNTRTSHTFYILTKD